MSSSTTTTANDETDDVEVSILSEKEDEKVVEELTEMQWHAFPFIRDRKVIEANIRQHLNDACCQYWGLRAVIAEEKKLCATLLLCFNESEQEIYLDEVCRSFAVSPRSEWNAFDHTSADAKRETIRIRTTARMLQKDLESVCESLLLPFDLVKEIVAYRGDPYKGCGHELISRILKLLRNDKSKEHGQWKSVSLIAVNRNEKVFQLYRDLGFQHRNSGALSDGRPPSCIMSYRL